MDVDGATRRCERRLLSVCLVVIVAAFVACAKAASAPPGGPPEFVPLGVYLSWERPTACARNFGIGRWTDVCQRLDALQANHVNLLWVTNMADDDLPRLIDECRKRGIRLLPSMSTVEAKLDWRWRDGGAYYDKVLPRVVKLAGDSKTLAGWVLSDEPALEHFPRLETLRVRLGKLDPGRFCTAVTMWPQTPHVPKRTKLPVVCVDLYPFFGPNDPNGPHTDEASQSFFRRNAAKMIEAIGDRDMVGWVMGMCFSDIWGPRRYDKKGHLIGLPGAYLHWRCPTPAEMRWQVWETFRSGAKGFVCYTLAPEAPDPKTATFPPPDVPWKDVLAKTATDMGPNALTNPDCSATPQLKELGRLYARIAPHSSLIRRWRIASRTLLETQSGGSAQVFVDPQSGSLFAVVLNDDLHGERDLVVRVGETITGAKDLLGRRPITLLRDFTGGSGKCTLHLAPGDGTILALTQRTRR